MPNVTVTIGTDSVITANNANSIVSLGSNSDEAIMLSKTLKYIYTSVKSDINFNATKQETSVIIYLSKKRRRIITRDERGDRSCNIVRSF